MNNLEPIPFDSVIDSNNIPYKTWKDDLKPRYFVVWRDILLGYLLLFLTLAGSHYLQEIFPRINFFNLLISAALLGFILAYLALFIHEAGHFNIHPNKQTNDLLATFFFGLLFGIDIRSYRKIHWQHHLHLGTPTDSEISYFNSLNWSFVAKMLSGIHLVKTIRDKNSHSLLTSQMQKDSFKMLLVGFIFNLLIILILFFAFGWLQALGWILAMTLFFPFFATLRQLLEHRSEWADNSIDYKKVEHGKVSRLFQFNLISRFFGGAGFTHHMIHHWDPQISYTRLKDVQKFLLNCSATREIISSSQTTYTQTIKKIFSK
jgi:fatty acid desaturase